MAKKVWFIIRADCSHFTEKSRHLPTNVQGRLLRLGETPDARDIQSLLGPVASQHLEPLATFEVLEHDGFVIAAAGQLCAIWTHLQRWACSWLSGSARQSLPKHVLPASSWFSRSDTAFLLLFCHPSACGKRSVLAKESLLAAVLVCALALHW